MRFRITMTCITSMNSWRRHLTVSVGDFWGVMLWECGIMGLFLRASHSPHKHTESLELTADIKSDFLFIIFPRWELELVVSGCNVFTGEKWPLDELWYFAKMSNKYEQWCPVCRSSQPSVKQPGWESAPPPENRVECPLGWGDASSGGVYALIQSLKQSVLMTKDKAFWLFDMCDQKNSVQLTFIYWGD